MFRERKFRIAFLPFFLVLMAVALLVAEAPRLLGFRHGSPLAFGTAEGLGVLAMGLFAVFCWAVFPAYLGPDGLRATDGIGRYHEVRWDEIRSVRAFSGFLWIDHGKWGGALCTPKYVDDRFGLRDYVRRHAPEGNPLRTYLMDR